MSSFYPYYSDPLHNRTDEQRDGDGVPSKESQKELEEQSRKTLKSFFSGILL